MNKDRINSDPIIVDDYIDDVDRACNPLGRFYMSIVCGRPRLMQVVSKV